MICLSPVEVYIKNPPSVKGEGFALEKAGSEIPDGATEWEVAWNLYGGQHPVFCVECGHFLCLMRLPSGMQAPNRALFSPGAGCPCSHATKTLRWLLAGNTNQQFIALSAVVMGLKAGLLSVGASLEEAQAASETLFLYREERLAHIAGILRQREAQAALDAQGPQAGRSDS